MCHHTAVKTPATGWEWDASLGQQPADEHVRAYRFLTEGTLCCDACGVTLTPGHDCEPMRLAGIDAYYHQDYAL